ncbi:mitogen-activated protein kinase kinase kinase 1-like isoform X2 [Phoenix dactylifera]|uniref:mitogen-activated protein kinase kinase kinase n=1 Tax=Phoenix dactylifera TaxID=42345 RepID=A0A8B9AH28_PHODC|nr:mitogen-activated protein kinase kinase kinase 1-like isoform X2 [Phoenix dactylifera]
MFLPRDKIDAFRSERGEMEQRRQQQEKGRGTRRLERRNAVKNIDYDASDESPVIRTTRSLDFLSSLFSKQTSFRIGGSIEGEVDLLYRSLGLTGPDDFAIPVTAWEARKARCSSDLLPRSRLLYPDSPSPQDPTSAPNSTPADPPSTSAEESVGRQDVRVEVPSQPDRPVAESKVLDGENPKSSTSSPIVKGGDGGIRGFRPPAFAPSPVILTLSPPPWRPLAPPPSMSISAMDKEGSTWDILRSFAPDEENNDLGAEGGRRRSFDSEENEEEEAPAGGEVAVVELTLVETSEGFTGTSSYSTINDDDTSSTATETMFIVSPNGRVKRRIRSWMRGGLLGSGSFGMVYEAISDEGGFFAVKEVSLLDQGSNAQQCILQLEQEIALLSQFEHENIVQYYGSDKEDSKLFIFLELVTQGSLASLYQKYDLQDCQVSAFTRQILNGLKFLHDRSVVHRDIKCANILVHVNGSVKLADFGLAKEITKFNMLKSCKGSVFWMAPEVVNPRKTYGPAADIWSLGCTVLEMLTRQLPYPDVEWTQAFFSIGQGQQPPIPNHLSRDARDFISQCVKVNPDERPSAAQLLEHPFVVKPLASSSGSGSSTHDDNLKSKTDICRLLRKLACRRLDPALIYKQILGRVVSMLFWFISLQSQSCI